MCWNSVRQGRATLFSSRGSESVCVPDCLRDCVRQQPSPSTDTSNTRTTTESTWPRASSASRRLGAASIFQTRLEYSRGGLQRQPLLVCLDGLVEAVEGVQCSSLAGKPTGPLGCHGHARLGIRERRVGITGLQVRGRTIAEKHVVGWVILDGLHTRQPKEFNTSNPVLNFSLTLELAMPGDELVIGLGAPETPPNSISGHS